MNLARFFQRRGPRNFSYWFQAKALFERELRALANLGLVPELSPDERLLVHLRLGDAQLRMVYPLLYPLEPPSIELVACESPMLRAALRGSGFLSVSGNLLWGNIEPWRKEFTGAQAHRAIATPGHDSCS